MRHVKLIAGGKVKNSPFAALIDDYTKRLTASLQLIEIDTKKFDSIAQILRAEADFIQKNISPKDYVIVLDERGKTLSSERIAEKIQAIDLDAGRSLTFVIGGAEGFLDEIRTRADQLWSFGAQTWPHLMARLMLIEQLYRAEQIMAGHPYHRRV